MEKKARTFVEYYVGFLEQYRVSLQQKAAALARLGPRQTNCIRRNVKMAKNYESESKTNKNNAGVSNKNTTGTSGKNASRNDMNTQSNMSNESNCTRNAQSRTQNRSQNKTSQSYQSEGNNSSGY